MKHILYYMGLVDLVWTVDGDGSVRLRIVWRNSATQERYVYGICGPTSSGHMSFAERVAKLNNDGTFSGGRQYLQSWKPFAAGKPKDKERYKTETLTWRK